jgi:hypothetical protein
MGGAQPELSAENILAGTSGAIAAAATISRYPLLVIRISFIGSPW